MKTANTHLVYYSATYTTRKIAREIARRLGGNVTEHDMTCHAQHTGTTELAPDDLLVAGVPVYAGRVPAAAAEAIARFRGNSTPAIVVCVYGNRDYEDALLELKSIVETGGFVAAGAAAFVAQHSIFSAIAAGRPDDSDIRLIRHFADSCAAALAAAENAAGLGSLTVRGNRPYKTPGVIPLYPSAEEATCTMCGLCASLCPENAINADEPYRTDTGRCISCGRCVAVCPHNARKFSGTLYEQTLPKFTAAFSARKEPEIFLPES